MSYQVLARRYRPQNFDELVGQEHVLRALVNALDQNRLHHAYLFTGTRGVGKTTIARILARCLNCETGITSKPCGECTTCVEIGEGRSIDLIEVDAASRTRVEDTRELLDNVQYMPSRSRFKVYLIDEVHMLSAHSFNALLKTLEEPPAHVKFLLATTEPKKLPVTVLSRCIQLNLKNMPAEKIVEHLRYVLTQEKVSFEEAALWQLGRAADGSMRDALSLTDQAISIGVDSVKDHDVTIMLGSIGQHEVHRLLQALITCDAKIVLERIAGIAEYTPDYQLLLAEILGVLHRVALAQAVPDAVDNSHGDRDLIVELAGNLTAEDVQLYYQIGLLGQRDMPLAPDPQSGFEMVLLRMLAFRPVNFDETLQPVSLDGPPGRDIEAGADAPPAAQAVSQEQQQQVPASVIEPEQTAATELSAPGVDDTVNDRQLIEGALTADLSDAPPDERSDVVEEDLPGNEAQGSPQAEMPAAETGLETASLTEFQLEQWPELLEELGLAGVTHTLAANCALKSIDKNRCALILSEQHASLWNQNHERRIERKINGHFNLSLKVSIEVGQVEGETPAQQTRRIREQRQQEAIRAIENDQNIQTLLREFDGKLEKGSIAPLR